MNNSTFHNLVRFRLTGHVEVHNANGNDWLRSPLSKPFHSNKATNMRKLTAEEEQSLLAYCQANPGQSYSVLRLWVQTTMGKSVVNNTIGNVLKRHGYGQSIQRQQRCNALQQDDRGGKRPASDFSAMIEPPKKKTAPSSQLGLDSAARMEQDSRVGVGDFSEQGTGEHLDDAAFRNGGEGTGNGGWFQEAGGQFDWRTGCRQEPQW
jgi:hypothetical protein